MTQLAMVIVRHGAQVLFGLYTVLVCSHLVVQVVLAHLHHRRHLAAERNGTTVLGRGALTSARAPSVDVSVPVYNEDPAVLETCLASIAALEYDGPIAVHVVDDASPNRAELMDVYQRYGAREGWQIYLPEANAGKRHVQDVAFRAGRNELFLTIDSDTEIAPDGLARLVAPLLDDEVGATTGDVRVRNRSQGWLASLIDLRYWVAFNQERASHSLFGAVLCCSGPFSVYRRDVLERVWPRYVTQTYRETACTYGDDRHLTNLVLSQGMRTHFVEGALAYTEAPTRMRAYLRQQLRWNKSYYRELLWTLTFLPRLPRFMTFEVLVQAVLPFLLTLSVVTTLMRAVVTGPHVLERYAVGITLMAVVHCLYGMARTRSVRFLSFVLYGFVHAALLIPVRLRALATLTDNRWGTRTAPMTSGAPGSSSAAAVVASAAVEHATS